MPSEDSADKTPSGEPLIGHAEDVVQDIEVARGEGCGAGGPGIDQPRANGLAALADDPVQVDRDPVVPICGPEQVLVVKVPVWHGRLTGGQKLRGQLLLPPRSPSRQQDGAAVGSRQSAQRSCGEQVGAG